MDCDALFASDDEIEVLPSSSEAMPTSDESQASKSAISSNCVNSTTPTQPFEVNLEPLTHPNSSHTPVPEEYQPLPDSSTAGSMEHLISGNGNDSTDASGQRRLTDMYIRYQPKPVMNHQRGYYYQNYSHYAGGVTPPRQYYAAPYHANNVIVLNDERNYLSHPMPYGLPSNHADVQSMAHRGYERLHADGNTYSDFTYHSNHIDDNHLHVNPERPSRKLNISPRRRQSKENETSSNLIVVSSEEEDNVPGLQNRQYENSDVGPSNISTNSTRQPASPSARIDIKREPHDQVEVATQAAGDADTNRSTPHAQQQVWDRPPCRAHSRAPPHAQPHSHCAHNAPTHRIKQENTGCANSRIHTCVDKMNQAHGGRLHNNSNQSSGEANQSARTNSQNGSHNHHHHYYRNVRQCANNGENAPGGSNPSTSQVKEEPGTPPINIKQESNGQQARCSQDTRTPASAADVKIENTEPRQVKPEPHSPSPSVDIPIASVKAESGEEAKGRRDMDAAGDRKPNHTSPEPGTSARPRPPSIAPSCNTSQVITLLI